MKSIKEITDTLTAIDISPLTHERQGFTYLGWAEAWGVILKHFPSANFNVVKFNGKPFLVEEFGVFVEVEIEIEGHKRSCQMAVMDGANNALKPQPYTITKKKKDYKTGEETKYQVTINALDMTDINNTIMRGLVKCLALFGLGLNLYQKSKMQPTKKPTNRPSNDGEKRKLLKFKGTNPQNKDILKEKVKGVRFNADEKVWTLSVTEGEYKNIIELFKNDDELILSGVKYEF